MSDKVSHEEAQKSPGERAHEAWCAGYTRPGDRSLPMWNELSSRERDAWKAVEAAVTAASESASPPTTNAEGLRVVWDWAPWARFLAARAQLIHEATAAGKSASEIRDWLSMDEVQVQLIAATDLDMIAGVPGAVWPPAKFQKKGAGVMASQPITFERDGQTWHLASRLTRTRHGVTVGLRSENTTEADLRAAGWVPASESAPRSTVGSRDGWHEAHALPSWLSGLFWLRFEDGTESHEPATRDNGAWWYLGNITRREHAPVVAYAPCVPPASTRTELGECPEGESPNETLDADWAKAAGAGSPPATDADRCARTVHSFRGMVRCLLHKDHGGFHSYDEAASTQVSEAELTELLDRKDAAIFKAKLTERQSMHEAALESHKERLSELEQRLARVAELAHDRDGDSHEWRSKRLGQCAHISWDHMEESFSDDPLKRRSTLKWASLAAQLTEAETKLTEQQAEHERVVADFNGRLATLRRLRTDAESERDALKLRLEKLTKPTTLAALRLAQKALCAYFGDTCDCKYGANDKGEQTGCPEMRSLIDAIEAHSAPSASSGDIEAKAAKTEEPCAGDGVGCMLADGHIGPHRQSIDAIPAAQPATGGTAPVIECKNGHRDGAYYKAEADNFYCITCQTGMGEAYYRAHRPAVPTPSPALPVGQGEDRPPGGREIRVFISEDGESLAFPGGGFTTVRACRHCGVLIAGGPTACVGCVKVSASVDQLRADTVEAMRGRHNLDDVADELERKGGKS